MKKENLYNKFRAIDAELAPGSETCLWGDFLNDWQSVNASDAHQLADVDKWWSEAYRRFDEIANYDSLQSFYDSIITLA